MQRLRGYFKQRDTCIPELIKHLSSQELPSIGERFAEFSSSQKVSSGKLLKGITLLIDPASS